MSVRFGLTSLPGHLALLAIVAACGASACQLDERDLLSRTEEASAGAGSVGDAAGQYGQGADGGGDDSIAGAGGVAANGASGAATGGAGAGGSAVGGVSGAAGTNGGNGGVGAASGNGTISAGSGGGVEAGGCPDIDQNGVDDCSETLIQNSRFDVDDDDWLAEPLALPSWDARNALPGTSSGSLLIWNQAPVDPAAGSYMVGAHQCLPIDGNAGYEVAVRALIPGAQGAGFAGINLQIFGADACAGSFLEAQTVDATDQVDTWIVVKGAVQTPSAARSMWVRLVVSKPFAQETFGALFDDVLVRPGN
jgi:hypothetical protein